MTPRFTSIPTCAGVRAFSSFSSALAEIQDARVFGGIHWRTACRVGSAMGQAVAQYGYLMQCSFGMAIMADDVVERPLDGVLGSRTQRWQPVIEFLAGTGRFRSIGGLQEFASRSAAGTASLVLWSPSTARGNRPFRDIKIRTLRCAQNAS